MMIDNLELFGVALMPIIVAVVEAFKKIGLPTSYAPVAAALLAVGGYWLINFVQLNPDAAATIEFWFNALIIFLGASGVYTVVKFYGEKLSEAL